MMNRQFALIGEHIAYSKSPIIHQEICRRVDSPTLLSVSYDLIEIPKESFDEVIRETVRKLDGFNVTIPYKEKIIPFLDEVDDKALQIGAVNTVLKRDNRLIGYNTDYDGFMACLTYHQLNNVQNVVVLGTGGAAKMVSVALKHLGVKTIVIVSRTPEKAQEKFDGCTCLSYKELGNSSQRYDLLVNCTPMGQSAEMTAEMLSQSIVQLFDFVLDLNYTPEVTPMMSLANQIGVRCANGLFMLVMQAIKAEHYWLSEVLFKGVDEYKMTEEILTCL